MTCIYRPRERQLSELRSLFTQMHKAVRQACELRSKSIQIMPVVCQIKKNRNLKSFCFNDKRTKQTHIDEIINLIDWKGQFNGALIDSIIDILIKHRWRKKVNDLLSIKFNKLSTQNTTKLQGLLRVPNKRMRVLLSFTKMIWHVQMFASENDVGKLNKHLQLLTGIVFPLELGYKNVKKHNNDKTGKFFVYKIKIVEGIVRLVDAIVNRNRFVIYKVLGDILHLNYGGDKNTDFGYSEHVAPVCTPHALSPDNSLVVLGVAKDIKDDYRNLSKMYHACDKRIETLEMLGQKPALVTFVKVEITPTNDKNYINSRLSSSCVLMPDHNKASYLNKLTDKDKYLFVNHTENNFKELFDCDIDNHLFSKTPRQTMSDQKLHKHVTKQFATLIVNFL